MTEEDRVSPESENVPKDSTAKGKEKKEKGRLYTKILCRCLPPTMTEESFLEQVAPIPEYDYFYFVKPDSSLTPDIFSRAYFNFVNVEDIFLFRDKFDDYIFLDDKGIEYPAIVEYAPFQRVPKKRRKKDIKSGTLESDPTYLEFLESLKEIDSDCREPKMEYSFQLTEEKKETTTPLLEFLASRRREEKRRKEERQRRRIRNRGPKEDDIIEEDVKKIKPREIERWKESGKYGNKKKEEDLINGKLEQGDSKERHLTKKTFKEHKKSSEESRKKTDSEKRDFKGKSGDNGDVKLNRKERRERQREAAKVTEKGKDGKKYSDTKRDKSDSKLVASPSFRQIDEAEQDEVLSLTIENKISQKNCENTIVESENSILKLPLDSSKIKPFTQLPQYKAEDLSKVIEEMDKGVVTKTADDSELIADDYEKNIKSVGDESISHQVQSSLESDVKSTPEESPIRRQISLDDKSQDDSSGKEGTDREKSGDCKKENRVRNKDRPSIVIYQPGMGKYSKQRIDKSKDNTPGTYKSVDPAP